MRPLAFTPPPGAELVEYEWSEETGMARFVYEITRGEVTAEIEFQSPQPTLPKHVGYYGGS